MHSKKQLLLLVVLLPCVVSPYISGCASASIYILTYVQNTYIRGYTVLVGALSTNVESLIRTHKRPAEERALACARIEYFSSVNLRTQSKQLTVLSRRLRVMCADKRKVLRGISVWRVPAPAFPDTKHN